MFGNLILKDINQDLSKGYTIKELEALIFTNLNILIEKKQPI